jgi:uncharacterized OB-fold protein
LRLSKRDLGEKNKTMAELDVRKPLPAITNEARAFWNAAAQQQLSIQRCQDCRAWVWTPRPSCNECGSQKVEWTQMSGKGEIYSFTVIRQVVGRAASKAFEPDIPYVIAWVDLDEGPRLITNIIGCPVEDVKLGMKVTVQFEKASEKIWLPKFKPAA